MVYNSAKMTLEVVLEVMEKAEAEGKMTFGYIQVIHVFTAQFVEQMDRLDEKGIDYESCRGVTLLRCGFRIESGIYFAWRFSKCDHHPHGGTHTVPERESIASFAAHQATMVVFFEYGLLEELSRS